MKGLVGQSEGCVLLQGGGEPLQVCEQRSDIS